MPKPTFELPKPTMNWRPLVISLFFVVLLIVSCGLFTTENARKAKDLHRELCDAFVAEEAETAGISLEDARRLWETSCMLNVGAALGEARSAAGPR